MNHPQYRTHKLHVSLRYKKLDDIVMHVPYFPGSEKDILAQKESTSRRLCLSWWVTLLKFHFLLVCILDRLNLLQFLDGLLKLDPHERWSFEDASYHPFITGNLICFIENERFWCI